MKRLITILTILGLSIATMAQVPQKISYQALIRDAENEIVANRVITLQIQFVTANGDAVYSETHQTATNANGVVSVAIGTGTTTDDFSQIDWSKGEFYLQTTIDLGASEKLIIGNSPLLSVPYALYAEKAGNVVEVDLSGYALKEEIPAPTDLTDYVKNSDLAEYAKTSAVNDTLSAYLLQKDAPTKLSQFENDANYITLSEVPETDLSGYYTKTEVNDTLSAYLLQKDAPTKVSQFENDANYITLNEVPETDLSGYYTKSEVNDTLSAYLLQKDAPTKVSQFENDAKYITLSEVPETDLSGYYTKTEIDDAFANYTTTAELNTTFADYAKKDTLADYAKKSEVAGLVDLSEYYLKSDVDNMLADLNGYIWRLNFQLNPPAEFSVSNTKKIYFSQGNLQYQASTGTWRFAENQWDFVGDATNGTVYENGVKCDNTSISATYEGWIDLFGWGTSGWNSGANAYQPYSTNYEYSDYYPGGDSTNSLTGDYANADWGIYNAISNGGNQAGMWRTLTISEWDYLINTRTDAVSKKGFASVNNVNGLILLPDDWTLPAGVTFTVNDNFAQNTYSADDWAKMESNGAVFLPAVGDREVTYMSNIGRIGNYWSSSVNEEYVRCLSIRGSYAGTDDRFRRHFGRPVRLVKDVE